MIKQLILLAILSFLTFAVQAQNVDIELNQNHIIGSKSISAFGGITKKGKEISTQLTFYSKSLSGLNKSVYLSYGMGDISKQTGTDFQNISLKAMLEKSVFQRNSIFFNLGVGPYVGFEKLNNSAVGKTKVKNFVPGISGFMEFENCFSSTSRWGVFIRAEQTYRYSSYISNLYYSVNVGIRYSIP